jgi:aerobic carbon-monoxide dehydrogenase medium subunit
VGLRSVPELKGISRTADGWLSIGASTTHREVELSPLVSSHCPALADAFSRVATVRIRNQATVGGNLVHADPAQDPPPMLLALDAEVRVATPTAEYTQPLDGFFTDVFETALQPGELLREIRVPPLPADARSTYVKFLPGSQDDYATVSVAAVLATDGQGVCTHARIGLGAVAPTALRAARAEEALVGRALSWSSIADAAEEAARIADPLDDVRGSAAYKRKMVRVLTARALTALAEQR